MLKACSIIHNYIKIARLHLTLRLHVMQLLIEQVLSEIQWEMDIHVDQMIMYISYFWSHLKVRTHPLSQFVDVQVYYSCTHANLTWGQMHSCNHMQEYKPPSSKDIPIDFRVELLRDATNPVGVLGSKCTFYTGFSHYISLISLILLHMCLKSQRLY